MANQRRNFGLDVWRAAAIMAVLSGHMLGIPLVGSFGVDLFFVLSGYLIGLILLRSATQSIPFGRSQLLGFWTRRWFRTLPNYYWFLLIYYSIGPAIAPGWIARPPHLWRYAALIQNLAWPVPGFFAVTWSLTTEEFFYLLFPLVFWLLAKRESGVAAVSRRFLQTILLFLVLPTLLRIACALRYPEGQIQFIALLRLDEPMYGVLLAWIHTHRKPLWQWLLNAWPAGVAVWISYALVLPAPSAMSTAVACSLAGPAFALILPAATTWTGNEGWTTRAIEKISLWSYSMYLAHMLLYDSIRVALQYDYQPMPQRLAIKFIAFVAIVIASALNYRFIEHPITSLRDRFASNPSAIPDRAV